MKVKNRKDNKYIVIKGLNNRVKFSVNNIYTADKDKFDISKGDTRNVMFGVEVLDNKYNLNTSFSSAGLMVYYGDSFWEAWNLVQSYIFNASIPKEFEKYAIGEP